MKENIHEITEGLFLIDLDLPREGFRQFISAWLYRRNKAVVLVDCGPAATYETLRNALFKLGVKGLDCALLTHIHLDHAGSVGLLVRDFPCRVVCHPAGVPHLISPRKLEEGARKVLGDLALAYGPVSPVPEDMLSSRNEIYLAEVRIRAYDTPGHAPHHFSFLVGDILFAGEVCGVSYPIEGGYLRPATPPPFRYAEFQASLRLISEIPCRFICFGHYGIHENPPEAFSNALRQLDTWVRTIKRDDGKRNWESYFDELLTLDPLVGRFYSLPADIQTRERFFIANTIKGIAAST